jgi:PIN domain nuclease of toxin-antitoxin system
VKLLLDTHIILWAASNSPRLSKAARALIDDRSNSVCFSVVSLWEIVIKSKLKRAGFQVDVVNLRAQLLKAGFTELPLQSHHVVSIKTLALHHKDPFDHALIAQAISENITLVTADTIVARYDDSIALV